MSDLKPINLFSTHPGVWKASVVGKPTDYFDIFTHHRVVVAWGLSVMISWKDLVSPDGDIIAIKEISKRTRLPITSDIWDQCLGSNLWMPMAKDYIKDYIQYNYAFITPSIWRKKGDNTEYRELINHYRSDITNFAYLNDSLNNRLQRIRVGEHRYHRDTIRLASYNVHFWIGVDGFYPDKTIKTIGDLSADIVALQEILLPFYPQLDPTELSLQGYGTRGYVEERRVEDLPIKGMTGKWAMINSTDGWSSSDLINQLGNKKFEHLISSPASTTHSGDNTFFGNAIVSSPDLGLVHGASISLTPHIQGRSATIVYYELPHIRDCPNPGMLIISVHLDVFDDTGRVRRRQVKELIDYIDKKYSVDTPVILMGDFNALKREDYLESEIAWLENNNLDRPIDFDTIKYVEGRGFTDAFDIKSRCALKSTVWSARRVDYIFTRNIPYDSIKSTHVFYSAASDHLPVVVDLHLNGD